MGRDKASEMIGGESLFQRVVHRIAPVSDQIIVAIAPGQSIPSLPASLQVETVVDLYPGKGSLGGIYSGLARADSFHSLVVACDMPFLNLALLRYLIQLSPGYDVVIPRLGRKAEPLHAIYSKNCLAPMKGLLERGVLQIIAFFNTVRVRWVEGEEIDRFAPEHLSFFNINTEANLEKARALAEQSGR